MLGNYLQQTTSADIISQMHFFLALSGLMVGSTPTKVVMLNILTLFYARIAQSVTCLATDACLTADLGVASSIPARSHTFVEIDHIITTRVILFPSTESFKKGCCQLQGKACARSTG